MNVYSQENKILISEIRSKINTEFCKPKASNNKKDNPEDVKTSKLQTMLLTVPFLPDDISIFNNKEPEKINSQPLDNSGTDRTMEKVNGINKIDDYTDEVVHLGPYSFIVKYFGNSIQRYLYLFSIFLAQNINEIILEDNAMEKNDYEFYNFIKFMDRFA